MEPLVIVVNLIYSLKVLQWSCRFYYSGKYLSIHWDCRMTCDLDDVWFTCEIEDDECYECIFQVARDEWSKSLLASGVPELQSKDVGTDMNIFCHKIYSNSWLYAYWITPEPSSNLSCMNLVKIDVFPVDCSPKNTTFILLFIWAKEDYDCLSFI